MQTIAERMKTLRFRKNLSVAETAALVGVAISTYREWENGRQIKGEPYERIAQALDVTLYELLTGETAKPSEALQKVIEIEMICQTLRKTLQSLIY